MRWFKINLLISLVSISFSFQGTPKAQTKNHALNLKVQNLSGSGAKLHVALYREQDKFPDSDNPGIGKVYRLKANQKSASVNLSLPAGEYALAIFEDLNGNGELDQNFLGVPSEPYGFSKNFVPKLSAPDFSDCAIQIPESSAITIRLID